MSRWVPALALLLFLLCPLAAQVDVSASLTGSVTDPSGAAIPGAQLAARNQNTGLEVKATTDARGAYTFSSLPPGTYRVSCDATGFKQFVASEVVLQAQKTVTVPVSLELGAASERVEVSAAAAMVDTVTATVQTTYDEKLIAALPVWGRDPRQSMELLMPGAVDAGMGASYNVPVTSFNGVSGLSNNYRIDGSDVNDYFHGSGTPFPQSENIAEFSVTTSVPDASVARGAGGQISTVMKSGTNDLHGQAWGYFQDDMWNANTWENNWQGIERQQSSQKWFGGNAGGPVYIPQVYDGRNKTFFFASYERTKTSATTTTTGQTITEAERSGDFSNSANGVPIIDGQAVPHIAPALFSKLGSYLASNTDMLPNATSGDTTYTWHPNPA
jgi:hypothetical protein